MKLSIVRKLLVLLELEILHVSCWVVNHLPTADMTRYGMNCINIKTISLNCKSILFPHVIPISWWWWMGGGGVRASLLINRCQLGVTKSKISLGWLATLAFYVLTSGTINWERNFARHFSEEERYGIRIESLSANKVYKSQPCFGCPASKKEICPTTKFDRKIFNKDEFENVFIFFRVSS